MKIYRVKTQEDYDALMRELERMGYKWKGGSRPTEHDKWFHRGERTAISLDGTLGYSSLEFCEKTYPNIPIIEYKEKTLGIKMEEGVIFLGRAMNKVANNNTGTYRDIINKLEQTYIAKNKDYGNSFEESLDEFGEIAGIVRIGDKFNRIKSLSKTEEINVKDESKIDTLMDMANYCIMQAKWLMKGGEVMSDKIVKCLSCNEQISEWDRIFSTDDGYYHNDCVEVVAKSWLIFDKLDTSICNEVEKCDEEFALLLLEEGQYLKEED